MASQHTSIEPRYKKIKYDPESFLNAVKQKALEKFQPQTKVRIVLRANMEKYVPAAIKNNRMVETRNFQSRTEIVLESTNKDELWSEMCEQVLESLATFRMNGSGWTFSEILGLDIHTVRCQPLKGGSWIPLPQFLSKKGALINMKNKDDQCFKWCVTSFLNPVSTNHPLRITNDLREKAENLNFDEIEFPVSLKDNNKFEKNNPGISVNVSGFDNKNKTVYPLRISKLTEREHKVNLMLLENFGKKHYCLVT